MHFNFHFLTIHLIINLLYKFAKLPRDIKKKKKVKRPILGMFPTFFHDDYVLFLKKTT